MEQKYIFPFSVLLNVLLRWCGVFPWLCDMYLLNVVLLMNYFRHHHFDEEKDADGKTDACSRSPCPDLSGRSSVDTPRGGEQQQQWSQRMSLDLSGCSGGVVSLSFKPDDVQVRSVKLQRCCCEDEGTQWQDSSSRRAGEVPTEEQHQHPPSAPEAASNECDTPAAVEGKVMEIRGEDTPSPLPPARLDPREPHLPEQRVARARAQAALRDRFRAREFAGKK